MWSCVESPELRSLSENIVEWRCVFNFDILGYYRHARIFPISNFPIFDTESKSTFQAFIAEMLITFDP